MRINKPIREKIRDSKRLAFIYEQYEDFQHGRGLIGKVTSMSGEFNLAILIATFVFGIDLKQHIPEAILYTSVGLFVIYLVGKFYRRFSLLEVEQRAAARRSPVNDIHLKASEIIIERFCLDKDKKRGDTK